MLSESSHCELLPCSHYLQELFCVCGALKRARLVRVGVAEVVFVRKEDAVSAYRKYNNRCLDGEYYGQGHEIKRALWVTRALGCVSHVGQWLHVLRVEFRAKSNNGHKKIFFLL